MGSRKIHTVVGDELSSFGVKHTRIGLSSSLYCEIDLDYVRCRVPLLLLLLLMLVLRLLKTLTIREGEKIFFSLFTISKYVCMVPEILFMPKRSVFQWLNKQALNDNVNSAIKSFNFPRFTLS